ncbi:Ger(x)C family spore germination protein [Paenibacillus aceris]|uniref:Ger(X)C family germination protein n=1 Tax=Paenibacillus aceris TaxID=869555 RepID=A0ABS4I4P9_9BACL|nr:Ger(x)C family spore germination protein [Paenibacillus aceris]MBP1965376.1 Ger(x)C family germination protein [Paenibacillus aceris]NHW36057.1 Ger(x)C family spore germination protein [Paenibacillus aceris]
MNTRLTRIAFFLLLVFLPGCDRMDVEMTSLGLMAGLDLNKADEMVVYIMKPVFSKEVKEKYQVYEVKARSLRESRKNLDIASGYVVGGKIQIYFIGKRLLEHGGWFPTLDVHFRDAKNTVNARVVEVDGEVADIFNTKLPYSARLSDHLVTLIDSSARRNEVTKTTLMQLDKQIFDRGITPYITSMKKEGENIILQGTTLLDKKGKYVLTLENFEPELFNLMQKRMRGKTSLTVSIPKEKNNDDIIDTSLVSFDVLKVARDVETSFKENKYLFNIKLTFSVALTERFFPFDVRNNKDKLEKVIQEQLQKQFASLFKKCQERKVDPFGFGLYARAYQYQQWKQVEDHWGEAFSKADVRITVETKIKYMGPVK